MLLKTESRGAEYTMIVQLKKNAVKNQSVHIDYSQVCICLNARKYFLGW